MTIIAILADDLTGACDAAAPFARRGLATEVVLDAAVLPNAGAMPDVLALDVDTRRLGSKLAATRPSESPPARRRLASCAGPSPPPPTPRIASSAPTCVWS